MPQDTNELGALLGELTKKAIEEPVSRNRPIALYAVNYEDLNWNETVSLTDTTGPYFWKGLSYRAAVMTDNPVAYWRFGDAVNSSWIKDETTGGFHGAIAGNTSGQYLGHPGALASEMNSGVYMTGAASSSLWIVPDTTALNPATAGTLECWVRPHSIDPLGQRHIIGKNTSTGGSASRFYLQMNSTVLGNGFYFESGSFAVSLQGGVTIGAWHHVVGVCGSTFAALYLNGNKVTVVDGTGPSTSISSSGFYIGSDPFFAQPFHGIVDEAAIYHTALSSDRVLAHYNAAFSHSTAQALFWSGSNYRQEVLGDGPMAYWRLGEIRGNTAHDESTNKFNGTYTTTTGITYGGLGVIASDPNTVIVFAGSSNSYVQLPSSTGLNITGDLTVEAWVRPDSTNAFQTICARGGGGTTQLQWLLVLEDLIPRFYCGSGTGLIAAAGTILTTGVWYHLVGTYTASSGVRLQRNGAAPTTSTGTLPSLLSETTGPRIGYRPDNFGPFVGAIDEVAVYNIVLSTARSAKHYALDASTQAGPQWRPAST